MIDWLFTNALAALALAAIAGVLIWTFRPSPAVRHALWLVVVLKLVSPTGLVVSLPLPVERPTAAVAEPVVEAPPESTEFIVEEELFTVIVTPRPGQTVEEAAAMAIHAEPPREATASTARETAVVASAPQSAGEPFDYRPYLIGLWALGAIAICWWQLRGTLRFARFARRGLPAGDSLFAEVAVVANRLGVRVPSVRVLPGLTSPVMWCLWRPVLLWPAGLECRLKGEGRRAVLAHELAHLRRRDHWVRRLEMVAAVLHWWNPLFWIARKKLRSDAELACDAWAAGHADRRAYAEALLEVCSFNPRRRPAPAVGVIGEGRRAMQERLTMIMRDRGTCRLAFGAKLFVALMAIAAVPAWTLGQSAPLPAKPAPTADPQVQAIEAQIKALAEKLEAIKSQKKAEAEKKAVEALKKAQETVAEKLKEIHLRAGEDVKTEKGYKVLTAGQDGVKVIGADGKELKDVKVIIVEKGAAATPVIRSVSPAATTTESGKRVTVQVAGDPNLGKRALTMPTGQTVLSWTTGQGSNAITLSRATYKLNKDQAAAMGSLLGAIKATVMETKVEGESITVTTTPEAQAAIGQIVRLLQGQGAGTYRFDYRITPPATIPAVPAPPKPPTPSSAPKRPMAGVPADFEFKLLEGKAIDLDKFDIELKLEPGQLGELKKLQDAIRLLVPNQTPKPASTKPDPEKKPAK